MQKYQELQAVLKLPFFSIIVPTYNRAHTLRRCIDSMILQTFQDWELIIVDDGSADATEELVKSYKDIRIKYVWQENQERSAARNHGIKLAKGDWICFQDSDDEYLPAHLDVLNTEIQILPSAIKVIRSGLLFQDINAGSIIKSNTKAPNENDIFPWECITACSFRKDIIVDVLFDERFFISEDLHFLLQISQRSEIRVLPIHTVSVFIDSRRVIRCEAVRNAIACVDDILIWYRGEKLTYVKMMRCRYSLGLLKNGESLLIGINECSMSLIKYPIEFGLVLKSHLKRNSQ